MNRHCHSCGMMLAGDEGQKARGDYCQYCADEKGNLHPREAVKQGIAQWLGSWSPAATPEQLQSRAESYMRAMPAWAE